MLRTPIAWREKFVAASIHFLATLLVSGLAAALIFLVWFPDPFESMLRGWKLFGLVVGCDLVLGPLISLVIYNSRKRHRELVTDYSIVVAVQLAALVYGVFVVSGSRPVYVVYAKDRLEVVTASEINDADLQAAKAPYRSRPAWGPRLVGVEVPGTAEEQNKALFSALAGKDVSAQPRYYVPYESNLAQIRAHAQPLRLLTDRHPESRALIATAVRTLKVREDAVRWLPVQHRWGFWTALIDAKTEEPLQYLPIDPY